MNTLPESIRFSWVWNDLWVGVYWKTEDCEVWRWLDVYVCPFPCACFRLTWIVGELLPSVERKKV